MKKSTSTSAFREEQISLPAPGPGTHREITVLRYGEEDARPKMYLQTALHADEIPGMLVLHHLRRLLDEALKEGRVRGNITVVPVANPIGMSQRIQGNVSGRLDLNNGKNYNRNYPDLVPRLIELLTGNLTADSEQNKILIRQALVTAVDELPDLNEGDAYRKILLALCADSDYCFDLHCDNEAVLYMYSSGTHPEAADQLSAWLGCALHMTDASSKQCFDGVISLAWLRLSEHFKDYPVPMGCMGSTIELRGKSDVDDETASRDAHNLMQFIVDQGMVDGVLQDAPDSLCEAVPIEAQVYLHSPGSGLIIHKKMYGDKVRKGEVVSVLLNPVASPESARTEIRATINGIIMSRSDQRLVGPGQIIMAITGKEIVPERVGSHLLSD